LFITLLTISDIFVTTRYRLPFYAPPLVVALRKNATIVIIVTGVSRLTISVSEAKDVEEGGRKVTVQTKENDIPNQTNLLNITE